MLTAEERQRLSDEIREQEMGTTGEIVTVIADRSGDYRFYSLLLAGVIALIIALLLRHALSPSAVVGLLLIGTAALFLVIESFSLHRWMIPSSVLHQQAGLMAKRCWVDLGISRDTRDRTGVMLFVSQWEQYVEVIADQGLDTMITNEQWAVSIHRFATLVKAGNIAQAYLTTVQKIGDLLNTFAPAKRGDNPDELPNHLYRYLYRYNDFLPYAESNLRPTPATEGSRSVEASAADDSAADTA